MNPLLDIRFQVDSTAIYKTSAMTIVLLVKFSQCCRQSTSFRCSPVHLFKERTKFSVNCVPTSQFCYKCANLTDKMSVEYHSYNNLVAASLLLQRLGLCLTDMKSISSNKNAKRQKLIGNSKSKFAERN